MAAVAAAGVAVLASGAARAGGDPTTSDCLAASEASISLKGEHKLRAARSQAAICAWATCPADTDASSMFKHST